MANIIYAKYNSSTASLNVLDPDTWVGGVVPGKNDVARFWYAGISTTNEDSNCRVGISYENRNGRGQYAMQAFSNQFVGSPPTFQSAPYTQMIYDTQQHLGYANSAYWGINNNDPGANKAGNAFFKNKLGHTMYGGPQFYKIYAKTFRVNGGAASSTTALTIDGTTFQETDTTTYSNAQLMASRMVELISGNIDPKYEVIGPHGGDGITNRNTYRETQPYSGSYFTIVFETASYTAAGAYSNASTIASSWYSGATNIYVGDQSNHYKVLRTWFTSSNAGIVRETGSYKFGVSYDWSQGSGYFYVPDNRWAHYVQYGKGIGPGTSVNYRKINFKDMSSTNYFHSCSIDESYSIHSTSSKYNLYPVDQIYTNHDSVPDRYKIKSDAIGYYYRTWNEKIMQQYHLTGSGHWEVGRIEMGDYNHFWVKDDATLTFYDLQDGAYYPGIDFVDLGAIRTTLLMTDRVTFNVSSSRTSIPTEIGINDPGTHCSLIISGAANYTASYVASSSNAGDYSLYINNASQSYGVGDYISIEGPGDYKVWNQSYKFHAIEGDLLISSSKPSASYADRITEGAHYMNSSIVRQDYLTSGSIDKEAVNGMMAEFTHEIDKDEVTKIVSMSGDLVTVGKRYAKLGEIHDDLGLYTHDQFVETFGESLSSTYDGSKRVVLINSAHNEFAKDDKLIINNVPATVLHATSFLSQSKFYDFTQGQTRADEIFRISPGVNSGSGLFTQAFNQYGITTNVYWAESYQKNTHLITGSHEGFKGSGYGLEQGTGLQSEAIGYYGYNASNYGGRSGSGNNYTALRCDPTLAYTWRNYQHKIASTNYLGGIYLLKNLRWTEGELTISGSLIRDGIGDPTSSVAYDPENHFGIVWDFELNQSGHEGNHTMITNPQAGYVYPYPYSKAITIGGWYGDPQVNTGISNNYVNAFVLGYSGSTGYGSANYGTTGPSSQTVYNKVNDINFIDELDGLDVKHISNPSETGSCHLRVEVTDRQTDYYVGVKGKEKHLVTQYSSPNSGGIGIYLKKYASIHSIDIKSRYKLLLLDTNESFTKRDKIIEGSLLEDHAQNDTVKFLGTEVTNVMGFKNLLIEQHRQYEYTGSVAPYTFACCRTGTTATPNRGESNYYGGNMFKPFYSNKYAFAQGQASANYFTITDFGESITFDTIGIKFMHSSYYSEYYINNKMNDVEFQVTNDNPSNTSTVWTTVQAKFDDQRQYAGEAVQRLYTFASGSVNARYLRYHSRGGTRSNSMYLYHNLSVYNISASCVPGTAPAYNAIRHTNGGPVAAICQLELANTKNWSVGDQIFFQLPTDSMNYSYGNYHSYRQLHSLTDYQNVTHDDVLGGKDNIFTITAINGNVITLDRPCHHYLEDGVIAFKFNRGKINFNSLGKNTAMMRLEHASSTPFVHMSHMQSRNSYLYMPSDPDHDSYQYISDCGFSSYAHNYYLYVAGGPSTFHRNIIYDGYYYGHSQVYPNAGTHDSDLRYNILTHNGRVDNAVYAMEKQSIRNFLHYNWISSGYSNFYTNKLGGYGMIQDTGKLIHKNIFISSRYPMDSYLQAPLIAQYNSDTSIADRIQMSNIFMDPNNPNYFQGNYTYSGAGGLHKNLRKIAIRPLRLTNNNVGMLSKINGSQMGLYNYEAGGEDMSYISKQNAFTYDGTLFSGKIHNNYNGNDFLIMGHYYLKLIFVKRGNEVDLYPNGNLIKEQTYDMPKLICQFEVFEDADVRFDLDLIYKLTFAKVYSKGASSTNVTYAGVRPYQIILLNNNREVLDNIDLTATTFETIEHRKIHKLSKGVYQIESRFQDNYNKQNYKAATFKKIDLKLVTSNVNNIKIYKFNFDVFDQLNNFDHTRDTSNNLYATDNGGKNKVVKQSSDLGGTTNYRFNKIKL